MEIKIDKLAGAIQKELQTFTREVVEQINERGDAIAKNGVKQLREASPKRTGRYAKGWALKRETAFGKPNSYIIYNKDRPWLAHLLEHGHAKRGGGRVAGQPHITPVEKDLAESYLAMVEDVIKR